MNPMFGKRVREARLKAGVTQAELAKALGVTQADISQVESGRRKGFGPWRCGLLAKALGGTAEEWLGLAADGREELRFTLDATEGGRQVLTLLWSRYRDMPREDWDRLYRAIENLPF